ATTVFSSRWTRSLHWSRNSWPTPGETLRSPRRRPALSASGSGGDPVPGKRSDPVGGATGLGIAFTEPGNLDGVGGVLGLAHIPLGRLLGSGECPSGLTGSTEGDVLGGRRYLHGDAEDGGGGGAHGLGAGGAADEKDSAERDADVGHGGKSVGQAEEHAFGGGGGRVRRGHGRVGGFVQGAGRLA